MVLVTATDTHLWLLLEIIVTVVYRLRNIFARVLYRALVIIRVSVYIYKYKCIYYINTCVGECHARNRNVRCLLLFPPLHSLNLSLSYIKFYLPVYLWLKKFLLFVKLISLHNFYFSREISRDYL